MPRPRAARDALLRAGYALLTDTTGRGLTDIRLIELTALAGVSNGAFYHSWPEGLPAFRRDLALHALDLEQEDHRYLREIFDGIAAVDPTTTPMRDLVRIFGAMDSSGMDENRSFRAQVAMWTETFGTDSSAREQLASAYQHLTDRYTPIYEALFAKYGLEPRPPFTARLIAITLTALSEGLGLRRPIDPDALALPDDPRYADWEMFGLLLHVLTGSLLQPVDAADGRDVIEFVDDLADRDGGEASESERSRLRRREAVLLAALDRISGELDELRATLAD